MPRRPVVKVVLWSRGGAHPTKPGWSKPHTHSNPTNLVWHKITLYRFNQGLILLQGAQMGVGVWAPLTLTTGEDRSSVVQNASKPTQDSVWSTGRHQYRCSPKVFFCLPCAFVPDIVKQRYNCLSQYWHTELRPLLSDWDSVTLELINNNIYVFGHSGSNPKLCNRSTL